MFSEFEKRMSEVVEAFLRAAVLFRRPKLSCVVSTFIALRLLLFIFRLRTRGTSFQLQNAQNITKASSIIVSSLTLASVFFGALWPTERDGDGRRGRCGAGVYF